MIILVENVNNRWIYDGFVRETDSPIPEQKEKICSYLERGLMDIVSKNIKKKYNITPKKLAVEFSESENNFEIIRIGTL